MCGRGMCGIHAVMLWKMGCVGYSSARILLMDLGSSRYTIPDISGAVNRTFEEIEAEFTAAFHRGKHDGEIMDIKWYSMDALIKDVSEGRLEFWPEHKEYMNMSKHFRRFFGVKDSLLNSRLSPPPRPRTPTKDTAVRKH